MESITYDWNVIESYLKEQLKDTKTILTAGTIGSRNLNHDIDLVIIKRPEAKRSDHYKEIHKICDGLDAYLRDNFGKKLIKFTKLAQQEEYLYLGKYAPGDLALHTLPYASLDHMVQIWAPDLKPDESVEDIVRKEYNPLFGSKEQIFSLEFKQRKPYDGIALKMDEQDRTNANFPEELVVNGSNHLFRFVAKHLGIENKYVAENKAQVREYFYQLLDKIDEKNKFEKNKEEK